MTQKDGTPAVERPDADGRSKEGERYRTLLEINNAIITKLTQGELLHAICEALKRAVPFDSVGLLLHEPEGGVLRSVALEGPLQTTHFRVGVEVKKGTLGWRVFEHQRAILRRDLETEQQTPLEHLAFSEGVRSLCALPLIAREESIGVLFLASLTKNQYSEEEISFLQKVANQFALAIRNMKSYEKIASLNTQVARSEKQWRAVFENSAIGVALEDMNGRFLAANPAYQKMLGYAEEELQKLTFVDVTHEDCRERNLELATEILAGKREQFQIEKQYRRKDGSAIWVNLNVSLVPATGNMPRFFMVLAEDIAERKRAQEALHKSEARARTLLEVNNAVITSLTQESLLSAVSKALHHLVPFDAVALFLHVQETDTFRILALEGIVRHFHVGQEVQRTSSSVGWVSDQKHYILRRDVETEWEYENERLLLDEGMHSHCVVPLVVRGTSIGTLNFASKKIGQYSEEDASLLQEVATQVALAVQNMKAYEDIASLNTRVSQTAEQRRILLEINNAIVSKLTKDELLHAICEAMKRAVPFDEVALIFHEPEDVLRVAAIEGTLPSEYFKVGYEVGTDSLPRRVFDQRRPFLRKNLEKECQTASERRALTDGILSVCELPLMVHDRCFGVLTVCSMNRNQYSEEDAAFLQEVANQVAIAIANMKGHEEIASLNTQITRAAERSRTLLEINNSIMTSLSQDALLASISKVLRRVVRFDRCAFTLYQPEKDNFRLVATDSEAQSDYFRTGGEYARKGGNSGWVYEQCRALLCRDLERQQQFLSDPYLLAEGIRSYCVVPMVARGKCIGTLNVGSKAKGQYSEQDAELLQEAATQVALAVENMKAYEEINALRTRMEAENVYLQEEILREHNFDEIVGNSPALLEVLQKIEAAAPTDATVLLYGETGTGKELLARAIHSRSTRCQRAMVTVNCGAIPAGLVESELFGHVKGAFTGALNSAVGRFELADRSTLFLDEVGELPPDTQIKLLRVLQEHEFQPVGSGRTMRVDVRIIAATNRNLEADVHAGRFRSDLFYRLNVLPLRVPPLRERRSDIPQLVLFFLERACQKFGKKIETVSQEALDHLMAYDWPGNIREMQNVIERGVVLSRGPVLTLDRDLLPVTRPKATTDSVDLEKATKTAKVKELPHAFNKPASEPPRPLEDVERDHIVATLRHTGGTIDGPRGAAHILGLHPNTLRARMKKLGIERLRA